MSEGFWTRLSRTADLVQVVSFAGGVLVFVLGQRGWSTLFDSPYPSVVMSLWGIGVGLWVGSQLIGFVDLLSVSRRRASPAAQQLPPSESPALDAANSMPAATAPPPPRIFASATPRFLADFFEDKPYSTMQAERLAAPYIGKWLRVRLLIEDVHSVDVDRVVMTGHDAEQVAEPENPEERPRREPPRIHCFFFGDWVGRVEIMNPNETTLVVGRITRVERFHVTLHDCEVVLDKLNLDAQAFLAP